MATITTTYGDTGTVMTGCTDSMSWGVLRVEGEGCPYVIVVRTAAGWRARFGFDSLDVATRVGMDRFAGRAVAS